jgi:hypothetical protein
MSLYWPVTFNPRFASIQSSDIRFAQPYQDTTYPSPPNQPNIRLPATVVAVILLEAASICK